MPLNGCITPGTDRRSQAFPAVNLDVRCGGILLIQILPCAFSLLDSCLLSWCYDGGVLGFLLTASVRDVGSASSNSSPTVTQWGFFFCFQNKSLAKLRSTRVDESCCNCINLTS